MAVGGVGLETDIHNSGNFSIGCIILRLAIYILLMSYYVIDIKTRVKNAKYH